MTATKRIIFNILATYGRSLFALALGLFSGRWALMALGQESYGLFGVVGGLTAFITFFNTLLGGSLGRFYAISIGQRSVADNKEYALEESRKWFNTGLLIHTVFPVMLLTVGYPLGEWAIQHWLTIPPDRLRVCVWVFRLSCLTCLVSMVNVPFAALYTARQYIAELTIYSFFQTIANFVFLYYMVTHPRDWLLSYAIGVAVIAIVPMLFICVRAFSLFEECRIRIRYMYSLSRLKKLGNYSFWQIFGGMGGLMRGQGIAILVNKYYGPTVNAAMTVANSVNAHTSSLSAAMQGAFTPAIVTAYGSGNLDLMRRLAYRASKFGMLLTLLFALPLSIELPYVMKLWLKSPPQYATGLCLFMMLSLLVDKASIGQMVACNSTGRIALYQAVGGSALILTLPVAWLFVALGWGVYFVGVAFVIMVAVNTCSRVIFSRRLCGMSCKYWLFHILLPVFGVSCLSGCLGASLKIFLGSSLIRLLLSTMIVVGTLILFSWYFVLDDAERLFVKQGYKKVLQQVKRLCHAA